RRRRDGAVLRAVDRVGPRIRHRATSVSPDPRQRRCAHRLLRVVSRGDGRGMGSVRADARVRREDSETGGDRMPDEALLREQVAYYRARAAEYDEWLLR